MQLDDEFAEKHTKETILHAVEIAEKNCVIYHPASMGLTLEWVCGATLQRFSFI